MAWDLTALLTEFYARGFSDLNDSGAGTTRAKQWLNLAMHEIDGQADWPYRNATTTGFAPLTISDLGTIESVTDVSGVRTLDPMDRRTLRANYGDLTTGGSPNFYYLTGGTTVNVYPASTSLSLTVDYWKIGPDLSAGTDVPLMPDRFRYAIVDYAVARATRDRGDLQGAADARASGDSLIGLMAGDLLSGQHQGPQDFVLPVGDDC